MNGGVLARRVGIVLLCVVSLVGCVGLAWWQWERFENGGTWQNLGYVLQWPLFGLFPAFVFWRLRKLGARTAPAAEGGGSHPTPPVEPDKPVVRQDVGNEHADRPADHHDNDSTDDPELAAYNRFLATLNERDQQQETR